MKTFIRFYVDSMTLESLKRIQGDIVRIVEYEELQIPDNVRFRVVSVQRNTTPPSSYLEYKVHYANNSEEERDSRTKGNRTYTPGDISKLLPLI